MIYATYLDDWDLICGRGRDISLYHFIQSGSGVHPASCPVGIRALSLGVIHLHGVVLN